MPLCAWLHDSTPSDYPPPRPRALHASHTFTPFLVLLPHVRHLCICRLQLCVEVLGRQHRHTAMLQNNLAVMLAEHAAAGAVEPAAAAAAAGPGQAQVAESEALFKTVSH